MKTNLKIVGLAAGASLLTISAAHAVDINMSGFIRQDVAVHLSDDENPANEHGNSYNGRTVARDSTLVGGGADTVTRPGESEENLLNLVQTKLGVDVEARFNDTWTAYGSLRAVGDWGVYDDYEDPNFFESPFHGDNANRLELSSNNYMIDLPSLYLDYREGPVWLRVGNQQIAWGESIFFRVLDVPNGLDLRRHLTLDLAAEEYADERVPSPGVRGSVRFAERFEFEAFAQMFNPSIIPNANTPYNFITAQFTVHQEEGFDDVDDQWNWGGRLKVDLGDLSLQFMGVSRRNPDGVFRWTKSGVNRDIPGLPGSGAVLANTAFEVSDTGVYSAEEWFDYAADVRLNGVTGLNAAVDDFQPFTGLLGAANTSDLLALVPALGDDYTAASQLLDLFFQLGVTRGHIERIYQREEVFGFGANYIFTAPGTFLDQLIARFETTYTPNKLFTNTNLGRQFIEEDEWVVGVAFEKYQRFTEAFPATYMVAQWFYKSESDLFGRHLSGYGGDKGKLPEGRSDYNAFSFAFQQPFPNLIWRADFAMLVDIEGGALFQPGLKWKPNEQFTFETFLNVVVAEDDNMNALSTIDYADELTFRLTYQF